MHMTVGFTSFIIFLTVQKLLGFWNNVLTGHLRCQLGEDTLSEWHVILQDAIYTLSQQHNIFPRNMPENLETKAAPLPVTGGISAFCPCSSRICRSKGADSERSDCVYPRTQ